MIPKQLRVPVVKGEVRKAKIEKMAKMDKVYRPVSKSLVKVNKMELHIQNKEPAKYVPIYFQAEIEKEKRSMFFE